LNAPTDSDVEVQARVSGLQFRTVDGLSTFVLGAYVGSTTFLRASLELTRASQQLHIQAVQNGVVLQDAAIPVLVSVMKSFKLRLLRSGVSYVVFLNDSEVLRSTWIPDAAHIELGVTNDASGASNVTVSVSKYVRNPVILFGSQLMTTVLSKTTSRIDVLAPPQNRVGPQLIQIAVEKIAGELTYDLSDLYTYTPVFDFKRVGIAGTTTLIDVSDTSVLQSSSSSQA
jgi:hypothetical protein